MTYNFDSFKEMKTYFDNNELNHDNIKVINIQEEDFNDLILERCDQTSMRFNQHGISDSRNEFKWLEIIFDLNGVDLYFGLTGLNGWHDEITQ